MIVFAQLKEKKVPSILQGHFFLDNCPGLTTLRKRQDLDEQVCRRAIADGQE